MRTWCGGLNKPKRLGSWLGFKLQKDVEPSRLNRYHSSFNSFWNMNLIILSLLITYVMKSFCSIPTVTVEAEIFSLCTQIAAFQGIIQGFLLIFESRHAKRFLKSLGAVHNCIHIHKNAIIIVCLNETSTSSDNEKNNFKFPYYDIYHYFSTPSPLLR